MVAGMVLARCACCREPAPLEADPALDAARRLCPTTRRVYLDRGDGLFEDTGELFAVGVGAEPGPTAQAAPRPDVLSDRPRRTEEKTRIVLERATFAALHVPDRTTR